MTCYNGLKFLVLQVGGNGHGLLKSLDLSMVGWLLLNDKEQSGRQDFVG